MTVAHLDPALKSPALILVAFLLACAQICIAQDSSASNSSWTASNRQDDPNGALNPICTNETHTEADGKIIDKKSLATLGPDGQYVPYQEIEKESIRVDATTVRTIERTFGTSPDGARTLVQVKEEESRNRGEGENSLVRTLLNPDANGTLQVVQRELQDARQISPGVQETKTTILTPDVNGGLTPAVQIDERQKKSSDGTVEFKKSTQLSDGAGHWQLAEVREGTRKQEGGQTRTSEENVLRPDSDGKLTVVERTVSHQAEPGPGEKRDTTDTYSVNVPGVAGESTLQLVQRQTAVTRKSATGQQTTVERTEQLNPGAPDDSLQVTNEAIDIVRPAGGNNSTQSRTILTRDSEGQLRAVWVDFGATDKPSATPAEPPTPAKPK
jgi:hypothetical protein